MELLLSLSKETSNSFAELMKMPMHITIGIYNALRKYLEKEAKARKEAEEKESARQGSFSTPSLPSFRMPNMPHF